LGGRNLNSALGIASKLSGTEITTDTGELTRCGVNCGLPLVGGGCALPFRPAPGGRGTGPLAVEGRAPLPCAYAPACCQRTRNVTTRSRSVADLTPPQLDLAMRLTTTRSR